MSELDNARTVYCQKHQCEKPGLVKAPFPGAKGAFIFENISLQAWQEWQTHQTRLVNEKSLNMMNMEHRKYIQVQMDKFLNNEEYDQAEGYVPEDEK
jgi:Fe-S cluster biosynthesis and repair protein YggX